MKIKFRSRGIAARFAALALALVMLVLPLVSCSNSPIEPTDEERQVVMKIRDLEVTYDLFRYLFLTYKNDIDGGDSSVWSSDKAGDYWSAAVEKITDVLCERYAVFDLAIANGVDIYGESIENAVQKYVDVTVDGNTDDVYANVARDGVDALTYGYYRITVATADNPYEGYGSRRKYRRALEEMYMTDNVLRLLFRQEVCDALMYYMLTDEDTGTIPVDNDTVAEFLNGPNYINTLWISIHNVSEDGSDRAANKAKAEELYARAKALPTTEAGDAAFRDLIINNTIYTAADTYMYPNEYLESVDEAAFALDIGETTEIIEDATGFYIIRRIPNDRDYIAEKFDELKSVYLSYAYYAEIEKIKDTLLQNVSYTEFFKTLNGTNVVWED